MPNSFRYLGESGTVTVLLADVVTTYIHLAFYGAHITYVYKRVQFLVILKRNTDSKGQLGRDC